MKPFPGIIFDKTDSPHPTVDSENAHYYLEFDKSEDFFSYYDNEVAFYKGVEKIVRKHPFIRKTYPKYLKEIVGLKVCEIMPGIESDDKNKVSIEMHHGPILTLFDTAEIITKHMRANGVSNINTISVAKEVVEQHRQNNVRVIFLSKSAHKKVHDEGVYLNYNQGFGDTLRFLEIFKDGVDRDMKIKINDYIGWSLDHDSTDSNIFKVAETMREWGNNDFDDFDENYF